MLIMSHKGDNIVEKYDDDEVSVDKDLNDEPRIAFVRSDDDSDHVSRAADNVNDPLVETVKELHFAQDEFEREVQKWKDVGKDDRSIFNDPMQEILELKDAKILELEFALSSAGINTELEGWLMKIIQADVEHVVMTATSKRLTEGILHEIKHNLQDRSVSSQDLLATKKQDGNLEMKEGLKKLQNRVCRFSSCFMIQLILVLVTIYLKLFPQNVDVVPT